MVLLWLVLGWRTAAAEAADECSKEGERANVLPCRLANHGKLQDAAWSHLPTIRLGKHKVTRLIAGWNPIGGHSHTTLNMARVLREHFTVEQTTEFLLKCEGEGINTWQYDHTDKGVRALQLARQRGDPPRRGGRAQF